MKALLLLPSKKVKNNRKQMKLRKNLVSPSFVKRFVVAASSALMKKMKKEMNKSSPSTNSCKVHKAIDRSHKSQFSQSVTANRNSTLQVFQR